MTDQTTLDPTPGAGPQVSQASAAIIAEYTGALHTYTAHGETAARQSRFQRAEDALFALIARLEAAATPPPAVRIMSITDAMVDAGHAWLRDGEDGPQSPSDLLRDDVYTLLIRAMEAAVVDDGYLVDIDVVDRIPDRIHDAIHAYFLSAVEFGKAVKEPSWSSLPRLAREQSHEVWNTLSRLLLEWVDSTATLPSSKTVATDPAVRERQIAMMARAYVAARHGAEEWNKWPMNARAGEFMAMSTVLAAAESIAPIVPPAPPPGAGDELDRFAAWADRQDRDRVNGSITAGRQDTTADDGTVQVDHITMAEAVAQFRAAGTGTDEGDGHGEE